MNAEDRNFWAKLVADKGLDFVIAFLKMMEAKDEPTSADFEALAAKYGSKTADQYLEEAKAKLVGPAEPIRGEALLAQSEKPA